MVDSVAGGEERPVSNYATIAELYALGSAPEIAYGDLDDPTKLAALQAASEIVDDHIRARYSLPLIAWGFSITEATCKIAAYNLLSDRGYNPGAGADVNIRDRYVDAMAFLERVQKQQAHPNVTPQPNDTPDYQQPFVSSFSVIDTATGRTAPNRGW